MSAWNILGFTATTKKVPWSSQQLLDAKDKLKTVQVDEAKYHPLDGPYSHRFVKKWVQYNPRPFDYTHLTKFRDVILDRDFPPIRQRFSYLDSEDDDDSNFWDQGVNICLAFGAYFSFLTLASLCSH